MDALRLCMLDVCMFISFTTDITIIAAIAGGTIATLLLLSLLVFCMLILYRTKRTKISSKNEKSVTQNRNEMANLNTSVTLDSNPSYHFYRETSSPEYDDVVSEKHTVGSASPYLDIIEETTRLHCKNFTYVGSTK